MITSHFYTHTGSTWPPLPQRVIALQTRTLVVNQHYTDPACLPLIVRTNASLLSPLLCLTFPVFYTVFLIAPFLKRGGTVERKSERAASGVTYSISRPLFYRFDFYFLSYVRVAIKLRMRRSGNRFDC